MKFYATFATLSLCACVSSASAEEPADVTEVQEKEALSVSPDRPTFTFGASTVEAGHGQFEIGGEFSTSDGESQLAFPVLARVGVAESLELRIGLPSFIVPLSDAETDLGALQLSAKVAGEVTDSLSLGALPYFDIATNSGEETAFSQSTFGFFLLWGYGLSDMFGIAGTLGASVGPGSTDEAGPRELFYAASLAASVGLGPIGVTAEGFTVLGQFADPTVGGSLSAGYPILDTLIVDVYAGSSAQSGATNVFAGAGLTIAR